MSFRSFAALFFIALVLGAISPQPWNAVAEAQTPEEIKQQIAEHNKQIADLDAEIAAYQKQLNALGQQSQSLSTSIKSLDVSRAQLTAKIAAIRKKIAAATLELKELSYQIADKQQTIDTDRAVLAASIRSIDQIDDASLVEQVFASVDLSDFWTAVDNNATLNDALREHAYQLSLVKAELSDQQQSVSLTHQKLATLDSDLGNQQHALDVSKREKATLLAQTKNKESEYQALIAKKRAQQKEFEAALNTLESSLKSVGAGSAPTVGQGILSWPFSSSFMASCAGKQSYLGNAFCITQYFGNTSFSTQNPQIYNGHGHNAIDIGVPTGTPVLSALSGTVLDTGNTDLIPGCYSFGKWVVIKHGNGLATLYAHLSSVAVSAGQSVATGQSIGNSGMTGYATGPHLHFGVYVGSGVQITTLRAYDGRTTACSNAKLPVAPLDAYLNPMSYL